MWFDKGDIPYTLCVYVYHNVIHLPDDGDDDDDLVGQATVKLGEYS